MPCFFTSYSTWLGRNGIPLEGKSPVLVSDTTIASIILGDAAMESGQLVAPTAQPAPAPALGPAGYHPGGGA